MEPRFEVFNRQAAHYDAWFDTARGRALFASELLCLHELTDDLPRPWLEVGVGTGRFAEALRVDVGVDPAADALTYAAERGIEVLRAPGETLPFDDGHFGAVFVIVTLCFAEDPVALLCEARRVVADSGGIIVGLVPAESPWGQLYANQAATGHMFYSRARFYGLAELESLVSRASLHVQQAASTLFGGPNQPSVGIEPPRPGLYPEAGFVALRCRSQPDAARVARQLESGPR